MKYTSAILLGKVKKYRPVKGCLACCWYENGRCIAAALTEDDVGDPVTEEQKVNGCELFDGRIL